MSSIIFQFNFTYTSILYCTWHQVFYFCSGYRLALQVNEAGVLLSVVDVV